MYKLFAISLALLDDPKSLSNINVLGTSFFLRDLKASLFWPYPWE